MAVEIQVDSNSPSRVNYFDGFFMKARDFSDEQVFHVLARQYLNYLLFNQGPLHTDGSETPLQVGASGNEITINPGTALIRDNDKKLGYEVHFPGLTDGPLNLAALGFTDGDTVEVMLQRREEKVDGPTEGGRGVDDDEKTRYAEQAVIRLAKDGEPASGQPFVLLATVNYQDPMDDSNVTNVSRGGLRYEILSDDLLARIGTPGPTLAITGIEPTLGPVGWPVVITGSGFATGATVDFGSVPATAVTIDSSTQITATVPSEDASGPITVHVGSVTATSDPGFSVMRPPTIVHEGAFGDDLIDRQKQPGETLNIRGTGFYKPLWVRFSNNNELEGDAADDHNSATVTITTAASSGVLYVKTNSGLSNSSPEDEPFLLITA